MIVTEDDKGHHHEVQLALCVSGSILGLLFSIWLNLVNLAQVQISYLARGEFWKVSFG